MISPAAKRYAKCAGVIAMTSGALAVSGTALVDPSKIVWTVAAWSVLSTIGIAGGVALVLWHGMPGPGFVVAMGTAMILRSIAAFALLVGALRNGGGAYVPCLVGLVAGFLPQQVFEVVWFGRARRSDDGRREPTREV